MFRGEGRHEANVPKTCPVHIQHGCEALTLGLGEKSHFGDCENVLNCCATAWTTPKLGGHGPKMWEGLLVEQDPHTVQNVSDKRGSPGEKKTYKQET